MNVGEIFEAKIESGFTVKILSIHRTWRETSFTGCVQTFPDKATGWACNIQTVGDIKTYSSDDFIYSISGNRDRLIDEILE